MNPKLEYFVDAIEKNRPETAEAWFRLERELKECLKTVSKEDEREFTMSGYGEAIFMACDALRFND
jgi:hypothetical protein